LSDLLHGFFYYTGALNTTICTLFHRFTSGLTGRYVFAKDQDRQVEYSPMVIAGTWKNYFDEVVGEFNASYVPGDSVWLRTIHQEISYATTQKLKKQSQLPHQMYLPLLHQPVRT